ncbi:FISUMP domain-containing protein [Mucilaginibacter psychrotolerans]|uniref:Fibrobacter succinogenes major paralogous domain-containing protein n=1 Tax=Mucilaginibacter psychrotolerans TaxID=1524096 RepID=A0A4Y8S8A0_9SPHI|nr:FISUMP domain-containing protein [Mucilaginibacter psychrotolerans]TFF35229.1 hypothetical protein E2R66_19900 [Mucilaginibacter psychrotolerans]
MKPKLLLIFPFVLLFFAACKKGGTVTPLTSKVTISGTEYATVKIGRQEWTSVNYNGPGGREAVFNIPTDPNYKKYYTLADLAELKLPSGWRIPNIADYNKLMSNFTTKKDTDGNYVGDYEQTLALRSATGWEVRSAEDKQGTNSSGFNAFPAGYYTDYKDNETPGNLALFLTSTPLPPGKANVHASYYSFIVTRLYVTPSSDDFTHCFSCFLGQGLNNNQPKSVRFVRDF